MLKRRIFVRFSCLDVQGSGGPGGGVISKSGTIYPHSASLTRHDLARRRLSGVFPEVFFMAKSDLSSTNIERWAMRLGVPTLIFISCVC